MNKNFKSLVIEAGGLDKLTSGQKDCRNYIDKARCLRLGQGDADSYFTKMQLKNSSFFYVMDLDGNTRLRNVFWTKVRSRASSGLLAKLLHLRQHLTNKCLSNHFLSWFSCMPGRLPELLSLIKAMLRSTDQDMDTAHKDKIVF